MEAITITLNGVEVSGYAGMTILDLARESGVYIPTLCHDPNLASTGACRLCLVEDEPSGALHASCVAPIAPGMVINTHSPRVVAHRKAILKLMLASHPDSCLVCDKGNRCQLRQLASDMGIGLVEFQRIPQPGVIEEVNPFIQRDLSKCIMCGKCIRADQEMVVVGAIDYIHRGSAVRPTTLNDVPLEKSECTFCGTCVAICPTGAIMEKEKAYTGTATSTVDTVCPYCGCGCNLNLGVRDGLVVRVRPSAPSPVNRGTLCVRGSYGYDFIHSPERLRRPLVRVDGELRETTWEDALQQAAAGLQKVVEKSGPESLAVFGSPRCTNEENYLLQRLARCVLGTNSVDNGSRLYSAASRIGLGATIGYAGNTRFLGVLELARGILVIGANPEVSAPLVDYTVKQAVRFKGARLCVIDPCRTRLTGFASLWLRPRIGTDIALLNGLARIIIDEKKLDVEFVTRRTDNYAPWARSLQKYTPDYVEKVTGVPGQDIRAAARLFADAEEASIVYGNGITLHADGTSAVIALANLAMLTGNIGRNGGIFALQRECNAHGACDMGTLPNFLPGYQLVDDARARQKFEEKWGCRMPEGAGLNALEMLAPGSRVRGMFITGENPAVSFPQPARVKEALASLDCLVVADMFLTETARLAAVVLPSASFAEKEGTFTSFEGRVQRLRRAIPPVGESLPDGGIIQRLAEALGVPMPYTSYQQITDEIEEIVPFYQHTAFKNAGDSELELTDIEKGLFGTRRLHKGLFPSGFGRFTPVEQLTPTDVAKDGYPLTLLAGTVLFQFGTGSRSRRTSRLGRFRSEAFLEISGADAKSYRIKDGDAVVITSEQGRLDTTARISDALPPGVLFMPISFPESPVYELFATSLNHQARAPALKSCAVKLERTTANG